MAATIQTLPQNMMDEMNAIKKSLSQYPGHKMVASSLGKFISQDMVAGLIGCIIPESGSNHTILNEKEYRGRGADGTYGWNCGEGLIQWTYWKYKLSLIKEYMQIVGLLKNFQQPGKNIREEHLLKEVEIYLVFRMVDIYQV